jgi:hypothetical protein
MQTVSEPTLPSLDEVARWSLQDTIDRLAQDRREIVRLQRDLQSIQQQFDWLRRQVFGQKSERRVPEVPPEQMHLGEMLGLGPAPAEPAQEEEVPGYKRKRARCDFPAGSAAEMYDSVQKLYALPDTTRVFPGHDYPPAGRGVRWAGMSARASTA